MIISYKNMENNFNDIRVGRYTNITGSNINEIDYLYNYLIKYFSAYKFSEYENYIYKSDPQVKVDSSIVSSKFYSVIEFNDDNIIKNINEILQNAYESVQFNYYIEKINENIISIINKLEHELPHEIAKYIDFHSTDLTSKIFYKNFLKFNVAEDNIDIEYISKVEKFKLLLKSIELIEKDERCKYLFIMRDIDKYFNPVEFEFINNLIQSFDFNIDISFINFTNSNYIIGGYNDVEFINIFSSIKMSIPCLDFMTDFYNRNNPINEEISYEEMYYLIRNSVKDILCENYILGISKKDVFIKIFNNCYDIHNSVLPINPMELAFLQVGRIE